MSGAVLVTGARGFVGRHLVRELGERAFPATADVTRPDELEAELSEAQPDGVVHLAAASSVASSWEYEADVWTVNALGTVNVLRAVRRVRPNARTLVVSSGEVYGAAGGRPLAEDAPLAPLSPYAASKAAAEIACGRAARADGQDIVVVRPFPHIGPGQESRFAVGSWTRQIAELESADGGVLRVGDLSVERDFTDVRDVCRAYRLLLDRRVPAGTYNVASGRAVRLVEVVDVLVSLARCPVTVERDADRGRRSDVRVLVGDASRIGEAAGWRPDIPLERTLADALDEARRTLERDKAASS